MKDALATTTYGTTGTPVVFLHGLFGQGRNWTQIAKQLAQEHQVVLVDLPNHGASAWTQEFSYAQMAAAVAELLEGLGEPAVLVGHSMGGKVAMMVALLYPERLKKLVVVDIAPAAHHSESEFAGYIAALKSIQLDQLTGRSAAEAAVADAIPQWSIRAFLLQNLRHSEDGWYWQLNLDLLERDLHDIGEWPADDLAGVAPYSGPTLWMRGERSDYAAPRFEPAMTRWFPRHHKVTIKGAGHWVHSEKPDVFLEVLRHFLAA